MIALWRRLPCIWLFFSCCLLNFVFNFCHFNYDMSGVRVFEFILFGTLSVSCTVMSLSFFRFRNIWAIIFSNTFFKTYSLFSFWDSPIMWMLLCLTLFQRSFKLSLIFFNLKRFFFAILIGWYWLFCLPDHLCVLYHLVGSYFPLVCFFISVILFLVLTGSFLYFLVLIS